MARNIAEIYLDNPSTTLGNNDLLYSGLSPYETSNDSAIKYSDLLTQLKGQMLPLSGGTLTGNLAFSSGLNINMPGASFINTNSINVTALQFKGGNTSNLIALQSGQAYALTCSDGTAPNGYFDINTTSQLFNFRVPVVINGDATTHVGISWNGITSQNIEQVPNNLTEALKFLDVAGNGYYTINSSTVRPKNSFNIEIQSNQPFFENNNVVAAGIPYNTTGALSASCSGTTVTGISTSFPSGCANGVIYWPSTQQYSRIVSRDSTTQLTIDTSITQSSAPFVIYYNGITYNSQSNVFALSAATTFIMQDGTQFSTIGNHALTLTTAGATNVTLPTTGTLVNSAVATLSSLTSIGTIGTGVWQGTVVGATYGGTGVNNGSSTITLGGNLTTSGAFTTTLTATANTSVTLPTSGTLATTQGLPMTVVSGTSQSAAVNNSYISNNAGLCTITLPSSAAVGDTVQVGGLGAGGWKIAQNASQLIHLGSSVTTTGTGGSLASSNQYDSISAIRCVVANTTWICFGVQGNITVV